MSELDEILATFETISLAEMDNVALMNRTDKKFVFRHVDLLAFLKQIKNDYRVLEVNKKRISKYETLYYDTIGFDLYHAHQRGKPSRYKIRSRRYVESDLNFFEIKFKTNKGRTIKNRVKQSFISGLIDQEAEVLLKSKTSLFPEKLEAKLWTNFSRVTLVNKNSPERVTIDIDLKFKNELSDASVSNLIIAEVKQDSSVHSPFLNLMKKYHVREGSMSKYCYGVINLFNRIKHNSFKPNLILIKKTLYGTFATVK